LVPPSVPAPSAERDSQETASASTESDLYDFLLRRVAAADEGQLPNVAPPAIGSVLGGKYQIEAAVGRGGMGFVFRARHLVTGRAVALKWMLPRQDVEHSRDRFLREAQAIGRIRHPNVVDIYDVESAGAATYLVMELLEGETLRARIKRGSLSINEVVEIAVSLLQALQAAHAQGVIHRDLKPENIFLARGELHEMVPKVLDFGTSMFSEGEQVGRGEMLTRAGQFVGTPLYTALERLRESQPFDHRVDIYSMGVIVYEALTGRLPFTAQSVSELTFQLATQDPVPARTHRPEIPEALERVVMQALARDPSARPADAESFARALAASLGGPRPTIMSRRRSWMLPAAGVLAVLVASVIWFLFADRPRAADGTRAVASPARAPPPAPVAAPTAVPAQPLQVVAPANSAESSQADASKRFERMPPSSATGAKPARVALTVVVLPYGNVWLDGDKIGASPVTMDVTAGAHVVAAGRETPEQERQVTVARGEPSRVVLSLRK
jgi:tRNA A-37 threonylcarbamoyl transferase component Bud32